MNKIEMKRKIMAIGIICTFLLTGLLSMSCVGLKIEKTNDTYIELIKPKDGDTIIPIGFNNFVICQAIASDDVDHVTYRFQTKYGEDDSWGYAGELKEPPYHFVWNPKGLGPGDWIMVKATGWVKHGTYYSGDAQTEWVTISIAKSRQVTLLQNLFARLPLLQLLKLR